MATYPDDATVDINSFSVVSSNTQTVVTVSATTYTLPSTADTRSEVLVIVNGVTQASTSYTLTDSGTTITFGTAPAVSSNLTLKVISVPARFLVNRTINQASAVEYNNVSTTIINSNNFVINANTESWSLPAAANVSSVDEIFVYLSGVYQESNAYTFPSVVYGTQGIDIGDNSATKLLLNFDSNANVTTTTDASDSEHVMTFVGDAKTDNTVKKFGESSLLLDGTGDEVVTPASSDFSFLSGDYTIEVQVKPASLPTANLTILGVSASADDFYRLDVLANANASFAYMQDGTLVEAIGGNVNATAFTHVAISFDHAHSNLKLYVANTLVAFATGLSSFLPSDTALDTAPLQIGDANIISTQNWNGHIDALRISKSLKYNTDTIATQISAPTVLGGGALGSIQPTDNLSIRVFDMSFTFVDRFTSMADRKPDAGFTTGEKFEVATFTSQAGYEKRRLKSRRSKRNYSLTYTNVSGVEKVAIEEFFKARSGEYEAFTFDLSHLSESGSIATRFAGDLSITEVLSTGVTLSDNFYTVSFNLQEVFD